MGAAGPKAGEDSRGRHGSSPVIGAGVANMADTFPKLAERRLREWYPERDIHVYNAGQYAADIPNWCIIGT
jgi:hypothetical protein